jgi:ABC-type dipeptide/oligopeptide/nickel transport system ATPase component/ABC-type dipeptide/oligopeptide/nickel transport system permease subunit
MSESLQTTTTPAPARTQTSLIGRLLRNPLGVASLIVLVIVAAAGLLAPWIATVDANYADISKTLASPDTRNLLGTDSGGRDILSRLLYGARTTLAAAFACAAVAISIGLPAGLVAGYRRGAIDGVADFFSNVLLALPGIIVLLTVRAAFGPSLWIGMIALGVILTPTYYRLTYTVVQSVRNELYVDAARVSGLSDARIMRRHILSVVRAPLIIHTAIVCGIAISVQSGLDFLGLGDLRQVTWGSMISDGFRTVHQTSLNLLWPALALGLTVAAFVLLGNALRDALEDPEKAKAGKKRGRQDREDSGAATSVDHVRTSSTAPARPDDAPARPDGDVERHLLVVSDLGIGYPQADGSVTTVVDDVSFSLDRGEVLGVVGESGSGKTQTAFSVLGLLPDNALITGGQIWFDGQRVVAPGDATVRQERLRPLRGRRIGYIPQEPGSNLDPAFTVGYQLTRPMVKLLKISKPEARQRAEHLLDSVGIPDPRRTLAAYPHEISGGMAQRVLIAGAISCDPDLVVADEPTTALDVTVQAEVLDVLRGLQERLGLGVVLITHNFGVVADICERVIVMNNGRIVEEGPVRTILRSPEHPYTRMLLDAMLGDKEPLTPLTDQPSREATAPARDATGLEVSR